MEKIRKTYDHIYSTSSSSVRNMSYMRKVRVAANASESDGLVVSDSTKGETAHRYCEQSHVWRVLTPAASAEAWERMSKDMLFLREALQPTCWCWEDKVWQSIQESARSIVGHIYHHFHWLPGLVWKRTVTEECYIALPRRGSVLKEARVTVTRNSAFVL